MKIFWTEFAIINLEIIEYLSEKANSQIAKKVIKEIFNSTKHLRKNPDAGQIEFLLQNSEEEYRYVVSGNYKIIYRVAQDEIVITDVFDTRQAPGKMNDRSRKGRG